GQPVLASPSRSRTASSSPLALVLATLARRRSARRDQAGTSVPPVHPVLPEIGLRLRRVPLHLHRRQVYARMCTRSNRLGARTPAPIPPPASGPCLDSDKAPPRPPIWRAPEWKGGTRAVGHVQSPPSSSPPSASA